MVLRKIHKTLKKSERDINILAEFEVKGREGTVESDGKERKEEKIK